MTFGGAESEKSRRPRFQDIAEEAGVGTATVERVLNGQANVLPQTAQRVIVAARRLGYDRTLPSEGLGGPKLRLAPPGAERER
jgi:hypothetical protein